MLPQLKDVVSEYEPAIIFSDGEWEQTAETWRSKEFLAWLFNESAVRDSVVVDDRWGKDTRGKHGGYYTTEYFRHHEGDVMESGKPWEECRGMGNSFGYNRNEDIYEYNSAEEIIHLLADIVSQGGNLLLDIGPDWDGKIPVIMQERMLEIGAWLDTNGEAIYNTRRCDEATGQGEDIRFTRSKDGETLYVICKEWPGKGVNITELTMTDEATVSMLGFDGDIEYGFGNDGFFMIPPAEAWADEEIREQPAWVFKVEK
jgi:alpha-L-fucosidase